MKLEDRTKWVEMLRSGKFPQVDSVLRNDDGYCCLGVWCEMKQLPSEQESCSSAYTYYFPSTWYPEGTNDDATLPDDYAKTLGLLEYVSPIPDFFEGKTLEPTYLNVLISMNDDGATFDQIADWIEENVPVD